MNGRVTIAAVFAVLCLALMTAGSAASRGTDGGGAHASVIGGATAYPGEFSYVAYVNRTGPRGGSCSGSVVAPDVVLTAAHCVTNLKTGARLKPDGYQVTTGDVNRTSPYGQRSRVTRIVSYPHFSLSAPSYGFGDVALLKLETPTTVLPVPLATGAEARNLIRIGTKVMVAGFGLTRPHARDVSEQLIWSTMTIEGTRCEGLVGRICALDFPKASTGICSGDSGGPLLGRGDGAREVVQLGISQAGYTNCSTRRPSIFMRIDAVGGWIRGQLTALE